MKMKCACSVIAHLKKMIFMEKNLKTHLLKK